MLFEARHSSVDKGLLGAYAPQGKEIDQASASQTYNACLAAAERGSAFAMCLCSRLSFAGAGVQQSNDDAFSWASKAAAAAYPPGHFELGKCYEKGVGVQADLGRARDEYERAAQGGFGFAATHLADLHQSGRLGKSDAISAMQFAELGNDLGEPMAPYLIATWYEEGRGVIRNDGEALRWYQRAAELGNALACLHLSMVYSRGLLGQRKDRQLAKKYADMCSEVA